MAKGKSTWKYNKLLTARRNYYNGGGFLGMDWSNPFKGANGAQAKGALMSAAGAAVGNIGGGLIGGGLQSGAGNVLQGLSGVAAAIPGPWGAIASSGLGVLGGLTNRMFGSKMNTENIAKVEANINNLNNFQSNASDFDTLSQNWANADVGMTFNDSYIGKDGWLSNKAKNKAADLRRQVEAGNAWVQNTLTNNAENIGTTQMQNLLSNYAAFGGPLLYSKGGSIHIKPENRGKFTETKRRTGKTTEELTHSSNPLTRKRAIFAQNAKKWHHAFGGELNTQGGDFTNGLLYIDNGGSHESNPYEGVPLGVDPEGTPNLVEEGETVFNDYVFSKRLKVPKAIREKYKLRGTKDLTFAEVSKKMAKESEERPNDPISMRGLGALMSDLASAQESVRERAGGNRFDDGGFTYKPYKYVGGYNGGWFGADGKYTQDYLNRVNNVTIDEINRAFDEQFAFYSDNNNKGTDRWKAIDAFYKANPQFKKSGSALTEAALPAIRSLATDGNSGFMHQFFNDMTPRTIVYRHMLRGADGLTAMPDDAIYYAGRNTQTGYTWDEEFKDQYEMLDNGAYTTEYDPKTNTETRTYFYSPLKKKGSGNRYYKKNTNGQYELVDGENPYLDIQNAGNYNQVRSVANDQDGTDYYFDPEEEDPEYKELPTDLRYTPAVGLGIAALTDAFGLTNKPDYGNAEAVLEASKGARTYQPVRFKPIGNYLTYKPFDRDFYINKMNAEAGATRRSLLNTSGGNRATAMAGILAADNNYLNQIGSLARQAEEYNLAQRQQVEDFNRDTNITNSQGFLQADLANQKALMDSREFSLKGTMAAAEMRERARLASEQAKSANLSGFVTALGDIGRENMGWNWRNFGLATGTPGNVGDEERLLTHTGKKKSKGDKMKRRKGLTV